MIENPFAVLERRLNRLEELLQQIRDKSLPSKLEVDEILDVQQAADFLSLAVPTVYALNSKSELPSMKRSKKLYFLKQDLIDYLKQGRRQSQAEIEAGASQILKQKKRGAK